MRLSCDYHVTQLRYVLEEKVLEVEIEPGMKDGYDYPFIAEGIIQISNYTITVSNIELVSYTLQASLTLMESLEICY